MVPKIRIAVLAAAFLGQVSVAALAGPYEDGLAAFQKEDYGAALTLLAPFARNGNPDAAYLLGEMYGPRSWSQSGENRNGVEQDNAQAIVWWTAAAVAGNTKAQLKLGWWLFHGKGVVGQDQAAGVAWLLRAAELGEPQAQFEVGLALWRGQGVPVDLVAAHMWLDVVSPEPGFEKAMGYRDEIAATLNAEQIAESNRRSAALKARLSK